MAQLMLLPLTVSCFSKIQIGFTFLVPAHPSSPGQRVVKQVCVCVCVLGEPMIASCLSDSHNISNCYWTRLVDNASGWPTCMEQSAAWTANVELCCLHLCAETKDIFIFGCQCVWELLKLRYIHLHITLQCNALFRHVAWTLSICIQHPLTTDREGSSLPLLAVRNTCISAAF